MPNVFDHRSILVTGASGQLGRELCRQLGNLAVPLDADQLDLTRSDAIFEILGRYHPRVVINTAAYTAVNAAENDARRCWMLNAAAVADLADATQAIHAVLVQISTDYVFGADPLRATPYREFDPPGPVNQYGHSKLEGEYQARRNPQHFIVRTCGLFGYANPPATQNFLSRILQLAHRHEQLHAVDDQRCSPTSVSELARAIRYLLTTEAYGTYHLVNRGHTTWYGLARAFFRLTGIPCHVEPQTSDQLPTGSAPRPTYSVLDTARYHQLGGQAMSSWETALSRLVTDSVFHPDGTIAPKHRAVQTRVRR